MDNTVPALLSIVISFPLFRGLSLLAEGAALRFGRGRAPAAIAIAAGVAILGAYPVTVLVDGFFGALESGWVSKEFLRAVGFFIGSGFLTYPFARFFLNSVTSKRDGDLSEAGE